MGISAWVFRNHSAQPFQARPLPLLNQSTIVEQPTNLATISVRYTNAALEAVDRALAASKPFFLYMPFNHVHNPNFAAARFCQSSKRGSVGDATQEMDFSVGAIMAGIAAKGLDESTVVRRDTPLAPRCTGKIPCDLWRTYLTGRGVIVLLHQRQRGASRQRQPRERSAARRKVHTMGRRDP
jgi:hypothetical protein